MGAWSAVLSWIRLDHPLKLIGVGGLFLFSEFLSLVAYNIVTASPGVSNPLFYSAGFVGYALADNNSFLQVAALGGVWALSALVIGVNLLVYVFMHQERSAKYRNIALLGILLAGIAVTPLASVRERMDRTPKTPVAVGFMSLGIQARDVSEKNAEENIATLVLQTIAQFKTAQVTIALIPEDARVFAPTGKHRVQDLSTNSVTIVHSGTRGLPNGRATLSGYASTKDGDVWLRNKLALAPQGEYLPSVFNGLLHLVGAGTAAERFSQTHALTNGEIGNPAIAGAARGALLFCSELLMPGLAKTMVETQRANILLIASSHSLFAGKGALETDILRYARVQTVEAGVPSVSSVTNGAAYALDRYGRFISRVSAEKNSAAVGIATVYVSP